MDFPPEGIATQYQWDHNNYLRTKVEWAAFNVVQNEHTVGLNFTQWQKKIGGDANSSYREAPAQGLKLVVRPNRHENGRAHLIVYNWDQKDSVEVDLGNILKPGQHYRIVSAQDFYGEAILQSVYQGRPLKLPMTPRKAVQPVGMPDYKLPVTEPEFGVFVILPMDRE
jgi:hypothetical protein